MKETWQLTFPLCGVESAHVLKRGRGILERRQSSRALASALSICARLALPLPPERSAAVNRNGCTRHQMSLAAGGNMRTFMLGVTIMVLMAPPAFAQTERAYITGVGGVAITPDTHSADALAEAGVRIAPHLFVFGDVGQFHNLQPSDVQPGIDSATAALSSAQGLNVIGTGRVPALYTVGGVRFEPMPQNRVSPYVLGGVGVAHLKPTAQFIYTSGALPDGSTAVAGDDVTTQIETAGAFNLPAASNALMYTLGGGASIPVARGWAVDAAYRFSRVNADTPLNAQGLTFGVGYRF
jgi:hypothetical protein